MFGWGSVSSALNTDKSVCAWKIDEKNNLEVFKTQQDSDSTVEVPSQQDTQIIVRAICNSAANSIIEDYVRDTRAWISSAESKLATVAEYNRINDTIRDFTKQSELQTELTPGRSRNSDILVLKRHRITDESAPAKRLKLEAINEQTLDVLGEMTQMDEYYSVIAGGMTRRIPQKGVISVTAPEKFNLDMIVAADQAADVKVPQPSNMLSQPFRNSLQLKSHMTSLVQAFSATNNGGGGGGAAASAMIAVAPEEHAVGNCFRHASLLLTEYKLAVRTFVNVLTQKSNDKLKSEFVIMEPGNDPVVLRKINENVHVSPNNAARVVYRIVRKPSTTEVVYSIEYRRPRRTDSQTFQEIATITYLNQDENETATGTLSRTSVSISPDEKAPPFCYVFRVPLTITTNDTDQSVYNRLNMFNLYNLATDPKDFEIALGHSKNVTEYIRQKQDAEMQESNFCWFKDFLVKSDTKVLTFSVGSPDTTNEVQILNTDNTENTAYYSHEILEPCVEAAAETQSSGVSMTKNHTVHNVVHFLHTAQSLPNHNNAFQQLCAMELAAVPNDDNWFLRLVPVAEDDVSWMSAHDSSIAEFTFQSSADESDQSFTWFLGGSPSPTLDSLEGALTFLSSQCSYASTDKVMIDLLNAESANFLTTITNAYEKESSTAFDAANLTYSATIIDMLVTNLKRQAKFVKTGSIKPNDEEKTKEYHDVLLTGLQGILFYCAGNDATQKFNGMDVTAVYSTLLTGIEFIVDEIIHKEVETEKEPQLKKIKTAFGTIENFTATDNLTTTNAMTIISRWLLELILNNEKYKWPATFTA